MNFTASSSTDTTMLVVAAVASARGTWRSGGSIFRVWSLLPVLREKVRMRVLSGARSLRFNNLLDLQHAHRAALDVLAVDRLPADRHALPIETLRVCLHFGDIQLHPADGAVADEGPAAGFAADRHHAAAEGAGECGHLRGGWIDRLGPRGGRAGPGRAGLCCC